MATVTLRALSLLSSMSNVREASLAILTSARMKVAPSSSKTSDTVVDVGMPRVLKTSRMMTSDTITARNTIITSWKV